MLPTALISLGNTSSQRNYNGFTRQTAHQTVPHQFQSQILFYLCSGLDRRDKAILAGNPVYRTITMGAVPCDAQIWSLGFSRFTRSCRGVILGLLLISLCSYFVVLVNGLPAEGDG